MKQLPFELTEDQQKVISEIDSDLRQTIPMGRLLQGDVGSGKTIVSFLAAAQVLASGAQVAFLAPTEILAEQQFEVAKKIFKDFPVSIGLMTQGTKKKNKAENHAYDFWIGTHALLEDPVEIPRLGLAIIDEQHRFGVNQRLKLLKKNKAYVPHLLLMTATPIPRTLSFTLYGDLGLSTIRQKPKDRKEIATKLLTERERPNLYARIRAHLELNHQVYIIFPRIEEDEDQELKSAKQMHLHLSKEIFPDVPIGLLHGKMKSQDKQEALQAFRDQKYKILVSTTVVEVGVDIPNATLMVIEHAERLGLSQLHQLRGRVGRSHLASECVLMTAYETQRLKVLELTNDGFKIAEEDLKLRGPGDWLGVRQHGELVFQVKPLDNEMEILMKAKEKVEQILREDPRLESAAHQPLLKKLKIRSERKSEYLRV